MCFSLIAIKIELYEMYKNALSTSMISIASYPAGINMNVKKLLYPILENILLHTANGLLWKKLHINFKLIGLQGLYSFLSL